MSEVLVLGSSFSGKSTLVLQIKELAAQDRKKTQHGPARFQLPDTQPTIGVDIEHVVLKKGATVALREVGGSFLMLWHTYLSSAKGIIFVVDSANPSDFSVACVEFRDLIAKTECKIPVCVFISKWESPVAASHDVVVYDVLNVDSLAFPNNNSWKQNIDIALNPQDVIHWIHTIV
eukprot:ANDGO_05504.mRNA.1 ADP-ribosylation factor-like protein 8